MSTLNVDTLQDKAGAFEHARLVQVVNTETGAAATGTTILPYDDTIPQNDEGVEVMTRAITPTHASNTLIIRVDVCASHSVANEHLQAALFKDSTAAALACMSTETSNLTSRMEYIGFTHKMTAGGTSEITFKVRIGGTSSGTVQFNAEGSNRRYGGVLSSSITISEIRV
jgi:hypothetical protein